MSSPIVNLQKALSTESLNSRTETSQQRLSLQHIFNSCVLDKHQRVNAGELIRHFRFVAEQNTDLLSIQFDFAFLLNQLGGLDQQVTFDQLFDAVEKLYSQLLDKSSISTPSPVSKSIASMSLHGSTSKKRRNKENIHSHTSDDASTNSFEARRKSTDHDKCKIEYNELVEINRRQSECLKMLEDEYKKLEDDHQRLLVQYDDIQKKKISLEDDLNRNSHYVHENVDLHVYKNQLETSYRDLKEVNEYCEREKFELQEQIIDMENQLQTVRRERDQLINRLTTNENQLQKESNDRKEMEEQLHSTQIQMKENNQIIQSLRTTLEEFDHANQEMIEKNMNLEKNLEELRQQLRNAKTESIEARLSLSNLCDEESFLCDELEERVDVSRRVTISNGQSLFAEINTIENISNECVSQYLDSSNMETIDDMEVQILLSKTDCFNSNYLKDVFHELHVNGVNIHENLIILLEKNQTVQDRESLSKTIQSIEKDLSTIKILIKKVIDNKDVFEGRFRKLQTLLIASREKQQKFQTELNEFANSIQMELTPTNVVSVLNDYHLRMEEFKLNEQISNARFEELQEQLVLIKAEEQNQRLKCISLIKQLKAKEKRDSLDENASLSTKKVHSPKSNLTNGICPFHSVQELLRHDYELFHSTSPLLPCRCLNRSRSTPAIHQIRSDMNHIRRLSSPCPSIPSDSGLNTSTACTTSRSPTPELNEEDVPLMRVETKSIVQRTLAKERKSSTKFHRSIFFKSDRVKRVFKKLQWCAIITSCSIVLFLWSVIIRYYCLTSANDDDCNRLSFAWWPFAYCSTDGITL